jgi:hypothetical protein
MLHQNLGIGLGFGRNGQVARERILEEMPHAGSQSATWFGRCLYFGLTEHHVAVLRPVQGIMWIFI